MGLILKLAEITPSKPYVYIFSLITYIFLLWFSIFILTLRAKKRSSLIGGLSILFLAIYIARTIIMYNVDGLNLFIFYQKFFWWSAVFPSVLWLHLTIILQAEGSGDKETRLRGFNNESVVLSAFYIVAFIFALFGPIGNWLFDFSNIQQPIWPWSKWFKWYFGGGAYYFLYSIFLVSSIMWAALNMLTSCLAAKKGTRERSKFKLLLYGTIGFVFGSIILSLIMLQSLPLPEAIGHIPLAIGILLVNYSIAKYDALVEGKVIKEKFLSKFWAVFSVLGIFIALYLFMLPKASIIVLLVITTFLLITLTFYEKIIELWERLFVDKRINQVKQQTKQMVSQLIEINPDEIESWLGKVKRLSKAEMVILDSIGKGFGRRTSEDISKELFLSKKTVDTHLKNIRKKLECKKSSELPLIWLVVNTLDSQHQTAELPATHVVATES